jgi:Na+-driven multidrug efflux pump
VSASALVGKSIGARNVPAALAYTKLSLSIGLTQSLIMCLVMFFGRSVIARFYTDLDELIDVLDIAFKVTALSQLFDNM